MCGLALIVFLYGQQTTEPSMADLTRLVARYKELHLPFPPKEAPLVFTGTRTGEKLERTSVGYKISRGQAMCGTIICDTYPGKQVAPEVANLPLMFFGGSFSPPLGEDEGLSIAIIEKDRGHDEFALAVLKTVAKDPPRNDRFNQMFSKDEKASLNTRLSYLALQHWTNSILDPSTPFESIFHELKDLIEQNPQMRNAHTDELLSGLQDNVEHATPGTNPVEKMIDKLEDSRSDGRQLESPDPRRTNDYIQVVGLAELGFKAIPDLIAHMDDKRFTRALHQGEMNDPNALVTIGGICSNLIQGFIPSSKLFGYPPRQADAEAWWKAAKNQNEREVCRKCLENGDEFPRQVAIRWAEKQFPDLLVEVHNRAVKSSNKIQTWQLLEGMVRSKLDRKTVIEAAKLGTKSKNPEQVHASNWVLEKLDKGGFDDSMIKTLNALPAHATGAAWLSREASFAQQAANSQSPAVWRALLNATKRADVDLRLQLIQSSGYAQFTPVSNKLHVEYLAAFLDDTSTATDDKKDKDGIPEHNHFGLDYLRVQNLAAAKVSYYVGGKEPPKANAPAKEWGEYRDTIRAKIKEFLAK